MTYQQGDVLLRKIDNVNLKDVTVISKKHCVLAHGESGHSHVIDDDDAELIQLGERILLNLNKSATLVHEEHKPIVLDKGVWEVGKVQEYDYFSQMTKNVQD